MGNFPGGSAYAMVRDIAEGFLLVTERTWGRLAGGELDQVGFEIDRLLRDVRGEQPALDDLTAIQKRNRKISRLTSALTMLKNYQVRTRRAPSTGKPSPGGG
ncbi:MAG: hypothetical protein U0X73_16700 [Thermoanaerobaculia bacterium]